MIGSYASLFQLGHKLAQGIFLNPVVIEEKVDGSQFSFGVYEEDGKRVLKCRSRGQQINIDAPEGMFEKAIQTVRELEPYLQVGYTYRAEYLAKPKHNTLGLNLYLSIMYRS